MPADPSTLALAVLAFLAAVLSLEGLFQLWVSRHGAEARRIRERLAAQAGMPLARAAGLERAPAPERLAGIGTVLAVLPGGARLVRWVRAAGDGTSAGEVIVLSAGLAALGLAVPLWLDRPMWVGVGLAMAFAALPWWWTARRRSRRIDRFERQFPEALDLMSRAMRAGHSFSNAVQMAGDELPAPLGADFRQMFEELNYGVSMNDALVHLSERVPLPDVSYFTVAVLIQRESGGNLAELLDKIASLVRARLKLHGDIRTLSAEGRLSAWILTLLPFALGLVITLINPKFIGILWTDPVGVRLVGAASVMLVLGVWWMRRIIRIHV